MEAKSLTAAVPLSLARSGTLSAGRALSGGGGVIKHNDIVSLVTNGGAHATRKTIFRLDAHRFGKLAPHELFKARIERTLWPRKRTRRTNEGLLFTFGVNGAGKWKSKFFNLLWQLENFSLKMLS